MIPLDSPRWSQLQHAYGSAADTPDLLRQLESHLEEESTNAESWFTLWSSLCHQGDVYAASFAAVPHILRIAEANPGRFSSPFLQLPACVEFFRAKAGVVVPAELADDYFAALKRIPAIVALASDRAWDEAFLRCALSAIAAAKGQPNIAEAALELNPQVAAKFMDWFYEQ